MNGLIRTALVAAAFFALSLPATAASTRGRCPDADLIPSQTNLPQVRAATLCLVNRQRGLFRLPPLTVSRDLAQAAHDYVTTMTAHGFFGHVSPDGTTPTSRIRVTLYLANARSWSIGENLAWGDGNLATPREMVAAWMRSPPHRHNMLAPRFRQLGVGIAVGTPATDATAPGATYATEFGVRVIARAATSTRRSAAGRPRSSS